MSLGKLGGWFSRLGLLDSASDGDPLAPNAPILTWTSASSDATPEFNIDFDASVAENDIVTVQYDDNASFSSPAEVTDTLDAGEVAAFEIDLALSSLAAGTYYVRANIDHSGHLSGWSNTVTVTIDASDDDDYAAWLAAA